MTYLIDNLRKRMKAQKLDMKTLSLKAGLSETAVRDIFRGRSKSPRTQTVEALAKALGCIAIDLLGSPDLPASPLVKPIPVIGAVEAGAWKEALEWPETDWEYEPIPEDPRFLGLTRFGLAVRGRSMNEVYREGDIVICIPMIELNEPLVSGRRYVIYRHKSGEIEATLKEYYEDMDGRNWLLPRSTDPAHKTPISFDDGDGKTTDVEIFARVTGVWSREP